MKIAIYWEQDSWGGVDSQLLTLLRTWPSPTDEFVLVYNRGNQGFARIEDELRAIPNVGFREIISFSYNEVVRRLAGVPFGRVLRLLIYPLQPVLFLMMAARLSVVFRKNGPVDVMLSDNGGYPAAWGAQSALIAASWADVRTRFLLVHHASTRPALFMGWYERLVDRAVGRIASAIICVSRATRHSLLDRRMINDAETRIRVIHNGIYCGPARGRQNIKSDLRKIVNAGSEALIGIVSRVQPYKGHEDLIFAIARLRENERHRLKLIVLGGGEERELSRLRRLADKLGIGDRVHVLGYVAGESVDLIAQLDLLVIATRSFEGFGLTLAEAMHVGTPILTTRVGAIPEFVDNSNGVLVNPGAPLEISAALSDFLVNREAWRQRSESAQKRIQAEGNRMADEYHRLFTECVAERGD